VDWLKANAAARAEYKELKRTVAAQGHAMTGDYADAKEPWFDDAYHRAWAWADDTGWRP
jgi:dephospho-CoA kinase